MLDVNLILNGTTIFIYLLLLSIIIIIVKNKYWDNKKWIESLLLFFGIFLLDIFYICIYKFSWLENYALANHILFFYLQINLLLGIIYFLHRYGKIYLVYFKNFDRVFLFINISFIILFIFPFNYSLDFQSSYISFSIFPILYLIISMYGSLKKKQKFVLQIPIVFIIFYLVSLCINSSFISIHILLYNLIFGVFFFIQFTIKGDSNLEDKKEQKNKILVKNLSEREKEVFYFVLENPEKKYMDISEELNISEKTVSTHLSNIYKKTEVKDKNELLKRYSGYSKE